MQLRLDAMGQGGGDRVLTRPSSVAVREFRVHDDDMAPRLVSLVASYHCHQFGEGGGGGDVHDHRCHGDIDFGYGGDGHGHQ